MPSSSKFSPLRNGFEPTSSQIFEIVDKAFENGDIEVSSMDSDEITFAGVGEPLLRIGILTEAAMMIKESRHGAQFRVETNGLVYSKDCSKVASLLSSSGINAVSVHLASDNPKQYMDIMKPLIAANFSDVCSFVVACSESGIDVTCTAVERPDVNINSVRTLAHSLGAINFVSMSYHP